MNMSVIYKDKPPTMKSRNSSISSSGGTIQPADLQSANKKQACQIFYNCKAMGADGGKQTQVLLQQGLQMILDTATKPTTSAPVHNKSLEHGEWWRPQSYQPTSW